MIQAFPASLPYPEIKTEVGQPGLATISGQLSGHSSAVSEQDELYVVFGATLIKIKEKKKKKQSYMSVMEIAQRAFK